VTDAARRDEEAIYVLWRLLARDTDHNLQEIVGGYYAGTVSVWSLSDRLVTALHEAHSHAVYLGRRLAGDRRPYGRHDQDFAASVMIGQGRYLRGLVSDIITGKYPVGADGALPADLVRRLNLYVNVLRATALHAWTLNLPAGTLVNWTLHPAEHCEDCTSRAAGGPYDAHTIPWHPADGSSACLTNCKCTLEIVGGGEGFPAVDLTD
jgi:hypothetical protein